MKWKMTHDQHTHMLIAMCLFFKQLAETMQIQGFQSWVRFVHSQMTFTIEHSNCVISFFFSQKVDRLNRKLKLIIPIEKLAQISINYRKRKFGRLIRLNVDSEQQCSFHLFAQNYSKFNFYRNSLSIEKKKMRVKIFHRAKAIKSIVGGVCDRIKTHNKTKQNKT